MAHTLKKIGSRPRFPPTEFVVMVTISKHFNVTYNIFIFLKNSYITFNTLQFLVVNKFILELIKI